MCKRSIWLGLFGLVLLAGCAGPYSSTERRVAHRVIPLGDYSLSTTARFFDEVEVARWDLSSVEEISHWTPERIDLLIEPTGNGLRLRSSSSDPSLFRDIDLEASKVKAFRVYEAGLTSDAYIQFYWARSGEDFSEERTLGASTRDPSGALIPSYTFSVRGHGGWTGDISKIRIDPTSIPDRRLEIYSVVALDDVPNNELIGKVTDHPWRVDINGDVRTAMLTPPTFGFQRKIEIPKRASLEFSIGLEPGMSAPVSFEITIDGNGSDNQVLFQETLAPGQQRKDKHWFEREIDLSSFSGKTLELQFNTSSPQPLNLFEGFPAWANIRVTTPLSLKKPSQKNVVLVIIDTLRADHVGAYGSKNPTTPRIDQWAKRRGVLFETTVAAAPWTLPSHASIFTGLDCLSHGVNTGDPMPPSLTTMAEILASSGYTTQAITGGAYLTEAFGLMQGFDVVHYWQPPSGDPADAGNDIDSGLDAALVFLEENSERPFFLLFHTYEVHTPYRKREPFFSQFHGDSPTRLIPPVDTLPLTPVREEGYVMRANLKARFGSETSAYEQTTDTDIPTIRDLYDGGVAYADAHIGRLLDRIDTLDLDDDTIVIVTADHGESLGEHGHFEHKRLNEQELLVPLIIASPDHLKESGSRVSAQVRLIDVLPTVLELAGLPVPADLDGTSLEPLMNNAATSHPPDAWSYASSSNSGLSLRRNSTLKYVFNNTVWPQVYAQQELYDLERDPTTDSNLAPKDSRTPQLYEEAAEEFDRRTTGVRVLFSNQMDVPMDAHLKGHIVDPLRIKAFGVKTDFLEWRYQMLNMVVPAHHSMVFHLEGNPFGEVYVTARFDVKSKYRTGVKHVMNLHQYPGPWQSVFDGKRWRDDPNADLEQTTGIRLWIQGPSDDLVSPAVIDEESRLLLQKLGYIQ